MNTLTRIRGASVAEFLRQLADRAEETNAKAVAVVLIDQERSAHTNYIDPSEECAHELLSGVVGLQWRMCADAYSDG